MGHRLYLIKNNQCLVWANIHVCHGTDVSDDAWNVIPLVEYGFHLHRLVTIYVCHILVLFLSKVFQQPSLAYLACAVENEWFVMWVVFPFQQLFVSLSLHKLHFYARTFFRPLHFYA